VGKVVGSNVPADRNKYDGNDIVFDIEVIESFKGPKDKLLKLNLGSMSSSCYGGYSVGQTILFYTSTSAGSGSPFMRNDTPGKNVVYQGSFCNRSNSIEVAQDQLIFLRRFLNGQGQPQIYGSVGLSEQDPDSGQGHFRFRPNLELILAGPKTYKANTDANGLFVFDNIPAGEYSLRPNAPTAFTLSWPEDGDLITVLADGTVAYGRIGPGFGNSPYSGFYTQFTLRWNNTIRGNVVDSAGTGLERFVVRVLPLAKANEPIEPYAKGSPDHHMYEGSFVFGGFAPGKYVIAVDVYEPSGSGKRRFFYPDVDRAENAMVLNITGISGFPDFKITLPIRVRKVEGEMTWSDGTSVGSRGSVQLKRSETGDDSGDPAFDWASTNGGKFDLEAIDGSSYWVHPIVTYFPKSRSGGWPMKRVVGRPVRVKVGESLSKLKFVFEKPDDFSCEKINDCPPNLKP
jgi:hypothetical protein